MKLQNDLPHYIVILLSICLVLFMSRESIRDGADWLMKTNEVVELPHPDGANKEDGLIANIPVVQEFDNYQISSPSIIYSTTAIIGWTYR